MLSSGTNSPLVQPASSSKMGSPTLSRTDRSLRFTALVVITFFILSSIYILHDIYPNQPSSRDLYIFKPTKLFSTISSLRNHEPRRKSQTRLPANPKDNSPETWPIPASPHHLFYEKNSLLGNLTAEKHWTQPDIITSFTRPSSEHKKMVELAVFTTGVTMGAFERNFHVAGCLLGTELYPVVRHEMDVFYCNLHRKVDIHEPVTVAIELDDRLQQALEGPVTLKLNLSTTLDPSRLTELPSDVRIVNGTFKPLSSYRIIVTNHTHALNHSEVPDRLEDYYQIPRYETCIIAPVKHTSYLLPPWVDYHRRVGFDHVYIVDNHDSEDIEHMFRTRPDVDVLYWPWQKSQDQLLTFSLLWARRYCQMLHICDSDEYLVPGFGRKNVLISKQPLKRFVRRRLDEGYSQLFFPYMTMNHSGNVRRPTIPPPETYVHRAEDPYPNGKSLLRLDFAWTISEIHRANGWEGGGLRYERNFSRYPLEEEDQPVTVHFKYRSYEEMVAKDNFGSGSPTTAQTEKNWFQPDLEHPPGEYLSQDPTMKFTTFRNSWRMLTRRVSVHEVDLIKDIGENQCIQTFNWKTASTIKEMECF